MLFLTGPYAWWEWISSCTDLKAAKINQVMAAFNAVQDTAAVRSENKGTLIKAGGYSYVAKGMAHYAWFTEDTVLQLHGTGPQGITYVNSDDDPRKKSN